jgi:hypothetical protein
MFPRHYLFIQYRSEYMSKQSVRAVVYLGYMAYLGYIAYLANNV